MRGLILLTCDESYALGLVSRVVARFPHVSWSVQDGQHLERWLPQGERAFLFDNIEVVACPPRGGLWAVWRRLGRCDYAVAAWTADPGHTGLKLIFLVSGASEKYVYNEVFDSFQLGGEGPRVWPRHVAWRIAAWWSPMAEATALGRLALIYRWTIGLFVAAVRLLAVESLRYLQRRKWSSSKR